MCGFCNVCVCVDILPIYVLVFTVFCTVCTVFLYSFVYVYLFLFFLYVPVEGLLLPSDNSFAVIIIIIISKWQFGSAVSLSHPRWHC